MNDDKKEKKDEGAKEYIEKVILNPNLEKELKAIGSPYKIPETPDPAKGEGNNTTKK